MDFGKQHACVLVLALVPLYGALAAKNETKPEGGIEDLPGGEPNLCSCALLNFYDRDSGRDINNCCGALDLLCRTNSSLACGHVSRFCGEATAGYSAWVLDQFVREELRDFGACKEFNPNATHDEPCGNGWCRIGYKCKKVAATRCREKRGLRCGPGYCQYGSSCANMSSENCLQVPEDELRAQNRTGAIKEGRCQDGLCSVCQVVTEYECMFQGETHSPCMGRACADTLVCGPEDEFVCSARQGALLSVGSNVVEEHAPEKVPESRLRRRLKAVVLPTLGILAGVICSVALISWVTLRVKRARREAAEQAEEDRKDRKRFEREHSAGSSINDEERPLSSRRQSSIPVRSSGAASSRPTSGRGSEKDASRRPRGSRTHYRSVSDVDGDALSSLPGEGIATVNTTYQVSRSVDRTRSRPVDVEKGAFPGVVTMHYATDGQYLV